MDCVWALVGTPKSLRIKFKIPWTYKEGYVRVFIVKQNAVTQILLVSTKIAVFARCIATSRVCYIQKTPIYTYFSSKVLIIFTIFPFKPHQKIILACKIDNLFIMLYATLTNCVVILGLIWGKHKSMWSILVIYSHETIKISITIMKFHPIGPMTLHKLYN